MLAERVTSQSLSDAEFEWIRELLQRRFGIAVDDRKRQLVSTRIAKLMRQKGHHSFTAFREAELMGPRPKGLSDLIDQLTTNHTFFWRESAHFDWMREHALPEMVQRCANTRDLRVWCAAASTGEEPYTLAMLVREALGAQRPGWQAGVLGTDISAQALLKASAGVYQEQAVRQLPEEFQRHFERMPDGRLQVSASLRREVTYRRFNLMTRPMPFKQKFHIVFCRNVMIYFDRETNRELARTMYDVIEPGGYLVVGHSEPLDRANCPFEVVGPSIYRKAL